MNEEVQTDFTALQLVKRKTQDESTQTQGNSLKDYSDIDLYSIVDFEL